MYISDLYIKNFRSIKDIHVEFKSGKNILIGKNNSGKSNIIQALDLLMGEKLPTRNSLNLKDFHAEEKIVGDNTLFEHKNDLFIAVKLIGEVSEVEGLEGINHIRQERFGIRYWCGFEIDSVNISEDIKKDSIDFEKNDFDYFSSNEIKYWIKEKEEVVFYIYAQREKGTEEINLIHGMFVKDKIDDKYFRCFPVTKKLRDSFITSSILPAFREPANQLKANNWTWYGKLIKSLWDSRSDEIDKDIKNYSDLIRKSTDKVFESATIDLKEKLEELISYSNLSFRVLPDSKDDIFKNISIYINDGFESQISEKGSGIQSALIIGLFSYYCSRFHKTNSLLAVEEPELFLHPHARRMLSNKLDEFVSLNDEYSNQVIIATHSQEFIRNTEIENIIVVRKSKIMSTKTFSLSSSGRNLQDIQKIKQLLWSRNSELFFADKVILVEGGEEYLIPAIADFSIGQKGVLDKHNVSVIKVGGKSQFGIYLSLLIDLGIDYFVVADFDYLENGLEQIREYIGNFKIDTLNSIRKELTSYKSTFKKSKEIKKKILDPNQNDAKALCEVLDEMCESRNFNEDLLGLWEYLRPKVSKKISYLDIEEPLKDKIDKFLNDLLDNNILILRNGELEDYYTELANELAKGVSGKELKVLKILEFVNDGKYDIDELIVIDEYEKAIFQSISIGGANKSTSIKVSQL
ncbi:ATP-dependent endonuclease [Ornithinibacillus sp. JPR2-1]|uniref:AAA family ATPase n=1 Tax=Ornithinibacillus sp. JPR2-1 TaxID=2094019 RepID=UPI0031D10328